MSLLSNSPFNPDNQRAYLEWRERKLENYPATLADITIEIADPFNLTGEEFRAVFAGLALANMVIYKTPLGENPDKRIPAAIMKRFGATRHDRNPEADENGVTTITPKSEEEYDAASYDYIPYSYKAIQWHTDGYYNPPEKRVLSLILHCVQNAATGGENELLDHEIMYILLRDMSPEFIRALMMDDVMTIPARMEGSKVARPDQPGPVFFVDGETGKLHVRYTHRTRSIVWKNDPVTRAAVEAIRGILSAETTPVLKGTLKPGWGLLCNNVLHTRSAFGENVGEAQRTMYRIRSYDNLEISI